MTDAVSVLVSCEQTLAIFLPLPFLCSSGKKVEVKISLSGSGCISPILSCSCQKIQQPKACFSLSNKSHTSVRCASLPSPFPVGFMPFCSSSICTLLPGTGTKSRLVPTPWSPKLGRSVFFPVVPSSVAWGRAHHCSTSQETSSTVIICQNYPAPRSRAVMAAQFLVQSLPHQFFFRLSNYVVFSIFWVHSLHPKTAVAAWDTHELSITSKSNSSALLSSFILHHCRPEIHLAVSPQISPNRVDPIEKMSVCHFSLVEESIKIWMTAASS